MACEIVIRFGYAESGFHMCPPHDSPFPFRRDVGTACLQGPEQAYAVLGVRRGSQTGQAGDSSRSPTQARYLSFGKLEMPKRHIKIDQENLKRSILKNGGGRGIRTPGTLSGTNDFKSFALNRSAIPPISTRWMTALLHTHGRAAIPLIFVRWMTTVAAYSCDRLSPKLVDLFYLLVVLTYTSGLQGFIAESACHTSENGTKPINPMAGKIHGY